MNIRQSITYQQVVEVPGHHTDATGKVAAETAARVILVNQLPGEETGNCQIVEVDQIEDIHIETLEIY